MQKKIIALAIAGLASTAAFAQSNVTVYGIVDVYAAGVGAAGLNSTVVQSGGLAGSRLGFKGVEDLGNNTKALFTLEYALGVDQADGNTVGGTDSTTNALKTQPSNGSGIGTARQAFVGLTGNYGTVIAGRLQTLAYNHNAAFNPTFGTAVDTQQNVAATVQGKAAASAAGALAIATSERLDNAVAYVAPSFGGVTLAGAYTTNAAGSDVMGTSDQLRAGELSANYTNGALAVGGVYRKVTETGAGGNGDVSTALGASYDFGVVKLFANAAQSHAYLDNGTAGATDSNKVVQFGLVAPVGANGAVIASVANATDNKSNKASTSTLAYKHSLSKRTALYAGIAQTVADSGLIASLAGVQSGSAAANVGDQNKVAAALVGINHSF